MSSFVVTKEDVANFSRNIHVDNQVGLLLAYETPQAVIDHIVPPHLRAVAPVVCAYICEIKDPNFGAPFMESAIWIPVTYQDKAKGNYFLALTLHGAGEECGKIVGRDCQGLPKKTADLIDVRLFGGIARARVIRHGVELMNVKVTLDGSYNDLRCNSFIGTHREGDRIDSYNIFHKVDLTPTPRGVDFGNARLMYTKYENICKDFIQGKLEIKMCSSPDDPYGELEVVKPLGAAWYRYTECARVDAGLLCALNTEEVMPYLMSGLYDRSMLGDKGTYLCI